MFKKVVVMVLSFVLLLFCSACGNKVKNKESVSVKDTENSGKYTLNATSLSDEVTFEKDGIKVTLTDVLYEDVTTKIMFLLNNKTDENVKILATDLAINGLMSTDYLTADLKSRSEKEAYIKISNEWLYEQKIGAIKEIEYVVRVLDETSDEKFRSEILKAKTKAPASFNQQYDDDGFVVFDKKDVTFLARELKKSKLSNDSELEFYVENNTDTQFTIIAQNVKVNGRDIEPTFLITVGAKKKAVDSMLFEEAELKKIKAEKIETVEASFKAFSDTLETVFETESIQIPVK